MLALPLLPVSLAFSPPSSPWLPAGVVPQAGWPPVAGVVAAVDPEEEEEVADDVLPLAEPTDEESNFDDFDDEFDDDFEEEENDPDWDHPDEGGLDLPPGKGSGGKK